MVARPFGSAGLAWRNVPYLHLSGLKKQVVRSLRKMREIEPEFRPRHDSAPSRRLRKPPVLQAVREYTL